MYGDKTGRKFPLKRKRIARCYFEIENCVPLNGTRKIDFPGNFFLKFDGDEREVAHFSLRRALTTGIAKTVNILPDICQTA